MLESKVSLELFSKKVKCMLESKISLELLSKIVKCMLTCADPGIFVRGRGPGQTDKKVLTTFFFYHFSRFQRGSNIFQGGSNFFQGGGSKRLFPIETHISCDFPGGGSGPLFPPPPSGSALGWNQKFHLKCFFKNS